MILFFTNSSSYLRHLFSLLVTGFVLLSINVVLATLSFSLFSEHLSDGTSYWHRTSSHAHQCVLFISHPHPHRNKSELNSGAVFATPSIIPCENKKKEKFGLFLGTMQSHLSLFRLNKHAILKQMTAEKNKIVKK